MIEITIGNSYSNVKGLTPQQEKALANTLSYIVGGSSAHFSRFGVKRKSLLDKHGNFPTGLIPRLEEFLGNKINAAVYNPGTDDWESLFKVKDTRGTVKHGGFYPIPDSYPWQVRAVELALNRKRGIISAPTGTGKSQCIKQLILSFGLKTLVVVPSLEIKKQMAETLKNVQNVIVENIDSKNLKNLKDFDVLIIDEAHHVSAKTYQNLNKTAWTNISYRFFFTATPFRNDDEEMLLFESIAGKVIYELNYKEAVENLYIVPVDAYYYEIPKKPNDYFTWGEVYSNLVVNNKERNELISLIMFRLNNESKSTLCLVKEVAHGKILAEMTGLPFVNGEDDESRDYINQFNAGKIKVLIGTTGILGEGIDTKPCEYVIISGLGKAKSQFMQQVGRSVRRFPGKESAKVILIKDLSHKFTARHFREQSAILKKEYGVTPIKLEI